VQAYVPPLAFFPDDKSIGGHSITVFRYSVLLFTVCTLGILGTSKYFVSIQPDFDHVNPVKYFFSDEPLPALADREYRVGQVLAPANRAAMRFLVSLSFLETKVATKTTNRLHNEPLPRRHGSCNVTEMLYDLPQSYSQGIGDLSLVHGLVFEKGYDVATDGHKGSSPLPCTQSPFFSRISLAASFNSR
jgi:hypothetical protein